MKGRHRPKEMLDDLRHQRGFAAAADALQDNGLFGIDLPQAVRQNGPLDPRLDQTGCPEFVVSIQNFLDLFRVHSSFTGISVIKIRYLTDIPIDNENQGILTHGIKIIHQLCRVRLDAPFVSVRYASLANPTSRFPPSRE